MKKYYLLLVIISCFSCAINLKENVRVNIVGYTTLDNFTIILNQKSKLFIDGKYSKIKKINIAPKNHEIELGNIAKKFNKIKIISNGLVTFNSYAGDQSYNGDFFITKTHDTIKIINKIGKDDYFASVLGSELGSLFSDEVLLAQSIAVRSYYYARKKKYKELGYDINNADGRDMVYRGADFATDKMYSIMQTTKNQILIGQKNNIALPLFHSTSAGIILKDEALSSKIDAPLDDPILLYDIGPQGNPLSANSPYYYFEEKINIDDLTAVLKNVCNIEKIKDFKIKYLKNTTYVDFLGIIDDEDEVFWIKGYKFLSLLQRSGYNDIGSINFKIIHTGSYVTFRGTGFGHFCGMSQYSAEQLANSGYNHEEILRFYYPDYSIIQMSFIKKAKNFLF